jgi:hypothetical protein
MSQQLGELKQQNATLQTAIKQLRGQESQAFAVSGSTEGNATIFAATGSR